MNAPLTRPLVFHRPGDTELSRRLRAAVQELLDGRVPDADRLAHEIALAAERLDVTEETVRLATHLDPGRELLMTPPHGNIT